jgi:hypothetical protein
VGIMIGGDKDSEPECERLGQRRPPWRIRKAATGTSAAASGKKPKQPYALAACGKFLGGGNVA